MPLTTLQTILTRKVLGAVPMNDRDGGGISFPDSGDYYLTCPTPWYYHASDGQAIGSMTAVAAGAEVHLTGPVTKYIKCRPGLHGMIKVEYVPSFSGSDPTAAIAAAVLSDRPQIISRPSDLTRSGGLAADLLMGSITLTNGYTWMVDLVLDFHQPSNTESFQWQIACPTVDGFRSSVYYDADSGAVRHFYEDLVTALYTTAKQNVATAVGKGFVRERLILTPSGSDVGLYLSWGNQSGGGGTGPTLLKGSHITAQIIRAAT
jgi:hypothetical protein